jgi:hypothetical protein
MGKPSPSVPAQPCNFPEGKQNFVDLPLSELDPEMHAIIEQEKQRQFRGGRDEAWRIRERDRAKWRGGRGGTRLGFGVTGVGLFWRKRARGPHAIKLICMRRYNEILNYS